MERDNRELGVHGEVVVEEGCCRKSVLDFFLDVGEDTDPDGLLPGKIFLMTSVYT